MFIDRIHAATKLAARLMHYKGKNPLVLAIPRGGVPMGKVVADAIGGELDVVLVHKLGHPHNQEYAIGAIDEEGHVYFDSKDVHDEDVLEELTLTKNKQLNRLKALRSQYTPLKKPADPKNRTAIIIDDGIATGWTVKAAVAFLRRAQAKRIVIATAVAPADTLRELTPLVDEVVCLETPSPFYAVGQFFSDFSQVTDEEVAHILRE